MKYLLASLSILSAVFAQILMKKASIYQFAEKKWLLLILLSVIFYTLTFITQTFVVRYFPISKILPVSAIAIMILIFVSGILFFGETVSSTQMFGIALGVVSILLILN